MGKGICGLASSGIAGLREEGITLSDEDIVTINDLARAVECPCTRSSLAAGTPVMCGGVWLWPLTIKANCWFNDVGCKLRTAKYRSYALAYAMAYGRSEGDELQLTPTKAYWAITKFITSLCCTYSELNEAMSQIIQQDECAELPKDNPETPPMRIEDLTMRLHAMAGGTADFWERLVSKSYALDMLKTLVTQQIQQSGGGQDQSSPIITAMRAYGYYLEKVRKRHREESGLADVE